MGKNIFRSIESTKNYLDGEETPRYRTDALDLVIDFVKEGSFSSYSKKDLLVKTGLWEEEDASKVLGVSGRAVRKYRSKYTLSALDIIGKDAFTKIQTGTKKEVLEIIQILRLYNKGYSSRNLYSGEFLNLVKEYKLSDESVYDISECKPEITLLHWVSNLKLETLTGKVDIDRLNYLLKVLDGKRGTTKDRLNLLKVITCDDPVLHCRAEDKVLFSFPPKREGY